MRKDIKKYNGFSLIEMLLTIMILSVVMLLVASTLNTVIKVSNTANSKNLARSDINYIMDQYSRLISNSDLDDIYLYNSANYDSNAGTYNQSVRYLGVDANGIPVIKPGGGENLDLYEATNRPIDGAVGTEIHVRLYGYPLWTCLGYFRDEANKYGYIVKTTRADLSNHADCFGKDAIINILHSFSVDATNFSIRYVDIGDNKNSMFIINAGLTPLYWPVSDSFPVTKEVNRQIVISTESLTWY